MVFPIYFNIQNVDTIVVLVQTSVNLLTPCQRSMYLTPSLQFPQSLSPGKRGHSSNAEQLSDHAPVIPLGFVFLDCGIAMEMSVAEMLWDQIMSALENTEIIKGRYLYNQHCYTC